MRKRTLAREIALKILYEREMRSDPLNELLDEYFEEHKTPDEAKQFSELLVRGTLEKLNDIDEVVAKYADNWNIKRMAAVDRNILRFAVFELLYLTDVPPKVTINEAVNIAKKYSQENAGRFVNGVLDKVKNSEKKQPFRSDLNTSD